MCMTGSRLNTSLEISHIIECLHFFILLRIYKDASTSSNEFKLAFCKHLSEEKKSNTMGNLLILKSWSECEINLHRQSSSNCQCSSWRTCPESSLLLAQVPNWVDSLSLIDIYTGQEHLPQLISLPFMQIQWSRKLRFLDRGSCGITLAGTLLIKQSAVVCLSLQHFFF